MKRIFSLIMALACMGMTVFAQAPAKINYQVVARDADNAVLQEQPVNVQIDILQGSATGTSVYTETISTTTNFDGLLSLEVNAGEIDWANGPYFIQTTVEGNVISTMQLMAVPYAFYAAKAGTDFSGKYEDLANKPEIPVIPMKTSEYDNDVPYVNKEAQELSLEGDKLTISDGNTVDLPTANKVEYIPVSKPKTGDLLYWDNDKQEWVLIQGGKAGDVLAYFEKPEWAAMDDEGKITQKEPESGCGTLVDVDGNEYKTVIIGKQCWMAENIRAKHYADGTALQEWTGTLRNTPTNKLYGEVYHETIHGTQVLYNWAGANNRTSAQTSNDAKIQGICPNGWHVPTYKEYAQLFNFIDPAWNPGSTTSVIGTSTGNQGQTGNSNNQLAIKLCAKDGVWEAYDGPGIKTPTATCHTTVNSPGYAYVNDPESADWHWNEYGFDAYPAGYIIKDKNYTVPAGTSAAQAHWWNNGTLNLWTSMLNTWNASSGHPEAVKIACYNSGVPHYTHNNELKSSYSVRCVSDETFGE